MADDARYCFNPPRQLTPRERSVTRWIIEHGDATGEEKAVLFAQLDRATVVRRCPCGCASVDFAIDGKEPPADVGLHIVGDFICGTGEHISGIFVFSKRGQLAGIEIYQMSDAEPRSELPEPETLKPLGEI